MGSSAERGTLPSGGGSKFWSDGYCVFDGSNDPRFPVELFVRMVEEDGIARGLDDGQLLRHVLDAGLTHNVRFDLLNGQENCESWHELKTKLMEKYGRKVFEVGDQLKLLKSLVKGHHEHPQTFLQRVKFAVWTVMTSPLEDQETSWTKVLFLNGLNGHDCNTLLTNKISTTEMVEILSHQPPQPQQSSEGIKRDRDDPACMVKVEIDEESDKRYKPDVDEAKSAFEFGDEFGNHFLNDDVTSQNEVKVVKVDEEDGDDVTAPSMTSEQQQTEVKNDTVFSCQICEEKFSKRSNLAQHCLDIHNGKRYKCSECHKELSHYKSLEYHMKVAHSGDKPTPQWILTTRRNNIKPMPPDNDNPLKGLFTQVTKTGKNGKTTYTCALCNGGFSKKTDFLKHSKLTHGGKTAKCDCCDFACKTLWNLVSHRLSKHNIVTPGYAVHHCEVKDCRFKAINPESLKRHVSVVHEGKKAFTCDHCHKSMSTKGALKLHLENIHMGMRRYSCEICGETFQSLDCQKTHVNRKHLNIQPEKLVCDECGEVYNSGSGLNRHLKEKHGDMARNFKCDHCQKHFFTNAKLVYHKRTVHQLDKKFPCPECNRGFRNDYDVKKHIATAHLNLKSYRCTICNTFYAKGCNLNYHIGIRHMGMSEAESRKKCKITRQHPAYEYIKPNEKLFLPFYARKPPQQPH